MRTPTSSLYDGAMPELVYLSSAKLQQFAIDRPWWRGLRFFRSFALSIPLIGELSIGPGTPSRRNPLPEVKRAVSEIRRDRRGPYEATRDGLTAGDWISFKILVNQYVPADDVFASAVFFLQRGRSEGDGSPVRILLHGSAENLRVRRAEDESSSEDRIASESRLFDELKLPEEDLRTTMTALAALDAETAAPWQPDEFCDRVQKAIRFIEAQVSPATATWTTGYARVTAVCGPSPAQAERLLVASPLNVEYVTSPPAARR